MRDVSMITNHEPPDPGPLCVQDESIEPSRKRTSTPQSENFVTGVPKRPIGDINDGVPSVQIVYTHPSIDEVRKYSEKNDKGPFIVHISRKTVDPNAGTSLHPMKFGHFLISNKIDMISRDGVRSIGRNRIAVQFVSAGAANAFLSHPALESNHYIASIPTYNVTRMGIVRDVPTYLSMDEFVEATELPLNCGQIVKARRLHRKIYVEGSPVWSPTQSIAITFEGQNLPEKIYSFHNSLPVNLYSFPTIQCMNCCRFGHVKNQCRSKARCFKCTQPHAGSDCNVLQSESTCISCLSNHYATDKICSEHIRQKAIKMTMAQESVSFSDAAKRHPRRKLFSHVLASKSQDLPQTSGSPFSRLSQKTQPASQPSLPMLRLESIRLQPSKDSLTHSASYTPKSLKPKNIIKEYDRAAHMALTKDYSPPEPTNGCALPNEKMQPNENLLDLLLATLTNIVTKVNDTPLPNNIAVKLQQLIDIIQNGQERHTESDAMEY